MTTDWLLGHFGKSVKKARTAYQAFILGGLAEKHRPEFYGGEEDGRLLGGDTFMQKCLAGSGSRPLRATVKDIASAICLAYNLDESMLKSKSQQRAISEARAMVGWLAYESGSVTLSEVSRHVNHDVGEYQFSGPPFGGTSARQTRIGQNARMS